LPKNNKQFPAKNSVPFMNKKFAMRALKYFLKSSKKINLMFQWLAIRHLFGCIKDQSLFCWDMWLVFYQIRVKGR